MSHAHTGFWVLAISLCLALCSTHEEITQEVTLGESVLLNCSTHHADDIITVLHWVSPAHLQIYRPGYEDINYKISQDGATFELPSVTTTQLGAYLCYFYKNQSQMLEYSKHNVLIHIPTILQEYKMNLMIGGIAAAVFFSVTTTLCVINAYVWTDKSVTPEQEAAMNHVTVVAISDGLVNKAYQPEEGPYMTLEGSDGHQEDKGQYVKMQRDHPGATGVQGPYSEHRSNVGVTCM